MLSFFVLYISSCSASVSMTFVFSPLTPPTLQSLLLTAISSDLLSSYRFKLYNYTQEPLPDFDTPFLINWSFSVSLKARLEEAACRQNIILLDTSLQSSEPPVSSCIYYTHPPLTDHSQALLVLLEQLEWESLFVVTSTSLFSRQIYSRISPSLQLRNVLVDHHTSFSNDSPVYQLEDYVSKNIKPSKNWNILILNEHPGSQTVLQSIKNKYMYKQGLGVVIGSLGSLGNYDLGTIVVVEKNLEAAKDQGQYEILSVINMIRQIADKGIQKSLKELFPNNMARAQFSVINYKTHRKQKIGEICNGTFTQISEIVYPGNVTEIPRNRHPLPFSINTEFLNYDGSLEYELMLIQSGAKVMVSLVNSDASFIPNYEFKVYETGCGPTLFDRDYFKSCYSPQLYKLGHFLMDSYMPEVIKGTIEVFREQNFSIPIIGMISSDTDLYNKTSYPETVIPSANLIYAASILPNILQAMRWTNVIVFATESYRNMYDIFVQRAADMRINILNDSKFHFLNETYTPEHFENYKDFFQNTLDTKGSIVVLFCLTPIQLYIAQGLYDIGFRQGNVQLIYLFSIKEPLIRPETYKHDLGKVMELLNGSLSIFYSEWVGDFGESLEPIIAQAIAPLPTDYQCFGIDSFLLGAHTIQTMIRLGKDFEDPIILMDYIRQQKFIGCSGSVSIDSSNNGRSILSYRISNFYNDTETNTLVEKTVGSYTIGVSVPLVISKDIVWPQGHTQPMPDIRENPVCGIPVVVRRELQKSKDLSLHIFIGLLCSCFIVSVALSYRYWRFEDEVLSTPVPMTFEDAVYMLSGSIEGVQLAAIAPCSSQIPEFVLYYMKMTILDIEMKNEEYWRLIVAVIAASSLWSVCCMISFLVNMQAWKEFIRDSITTIGVRLFPYVSLLCLIPFSRTLFSVFVCQEASGEDLTDAYFYRDCNISCWKGFHFVFVVLSSISLFLYLTVATLSRLYWDEYSDYTHIKTNPRYALWKGLLYGTLAGLSILPIEEDMYRILYFALLGVYGILSFAMFQTNYKRFNSWLRIGIVGIAWVGLINSLGEGKSVKLTASLQLGGLGVLGIVGVVLQIKYFPSMLYRKKGVRVYDLMRFGLTRKISKDSINQIIRDHKAEQLRSELKYIENNDE